MKSLIRPYAAKDKKKLLEIFLKNTPQFFGINELNDYKTYLEENSSTYLTVEYKQEIAGGAGYYVEESDNSGRITWIFFDPDYRGKGLGSEVVYHCLDLLKRDQRVHKFVVTTSQLASDFFKKFGFKLVRQQKDYWAKGLDLYQMEKEKG